MVKVLEDVGFEFVLLIFLDVVIVLKFYEIFFYFWNFEVEGFFDGDCWWYCEFIWIYYGIDDEGFFWGDGLIDCCGDVCGVFYLDIVVIVSFCIGGKIWID